MSSVFLLILPLVYAVNATAAALPITFEENRGQAPAEVRFLTRASGYPVLLTRQGAVVTLQNRNAVRMTLMKSNDTAPIGAGLLPAKTNYLLGSDPAQWKKGIANYEQVTYPGVYPGIDLTWHADGDQIEHDFLVAAGADP